MRRRSAWITPSPAAKSARAMTGDTQRHTPVRRSRSGGASGVGGCGTVASVTRGGVRWRSGGGPRNVRAPRAARKRPKGSYPPRAALILFASHRSAVAPASDIPPKEESTDAPCLPLATADSARRSAEVTGRARQRIVSRSAAEPRRGDGVSLRVSASLGLSRRHPSTLRRSTVDPRARVPNPITPAHGRGGDEGRAGGARALGALAGAGLRVPGDAAAAGDALAGGGGGVLPLGPRPSGGMGNAARAGGGAGGADPPARPGDPGAARAGDGCRRAVDVDAAGRRGRGDGG